MIQIRSLCQKNSKNNSMAGGILNWFIKILLAVIFSIFSFMAPVSVADSITDGVEYDKSVLSRLVVELSAMEVLIDEASQAPKSSGTRLNFDYSALRSDLELIKSGINDYLQSSTLPRVKPIKPMNGHYAQ